MTVVPFQAREYCAQQFETIVDGAVWKFAGTLCGTIDIKTPAGTLCVTPDEALRVIACLRAARTDVLEHSNPNSDPRLQD